MARVVESTCVEAEQIYFELDRFELTDGDRLAVSGRWFGVRGRRFVRPTLTMLTADGVSRSLADLAHKPWAAEDGQSWTAEFSPPGDADDWREVELAVAPDIEVALPAPGPVVKGDKRPSAAAARRGGTERSARSQPRAHARPRSVSSHSELDRLRHELASARREIERLTAERASAEGAQVEAAAALARRAAALTELESVTAKLESVTAERDAAVQARDRAAADLAELRRSGEERERMRDAAQEARDRALEEREEALRAHRRDVPELRRRLEELTRQIAARDGRLEELLAVVADRDARLAELAPVAAERDAALAARDEAVSQRQAAAESLKRLESERAALSSARGAALVMQDSAKFSGVHRRDLDWISRGLAVVLLLAALCAVAIIAHLV
jgi:hypothetical protein